MTDENKQPSFNDVAKMAGLQYIALAQVVDKSLANLTRRGVRRALFAAIDFNVTDSKVQFRTKEEAKVAGMLAKLLDLRTIIMANRLKEQDEKGDENGKEEQKEEMGDSGNSSQE